MSLNNNLPIVPPGVFAAAGPGDEPEAATRDVDGDEVLDDEVDPAQVSSIDADRLATQSDD